MTLVLTKDFVDRVSCFILALYVEDQLNSCSYHRY